MYFRIFTEKLIPMSVLRAPALMRSLSVCVQTNVHPHRQTTIWRSKTEQIVLCLNENNILCNFLCHFIQFSMHWSLSALCMERWREREIAERRFSDSKMTQHTKVLFLEVEATILHLTNKNQMYSKSIKITFSPGFIHILLCVISSLLCSRKKSEFGVKTMCNVLFKLYMRLQTLTHRKQKQDDDN